MKYPVLVFLLLAIFSMPLYAYRIEINKVSNQGWTLLGDNGAPIIVKGICYSPTPIGRGVWDVDFSSDDKSSVFLDADKMQMMGANLIRIYRPGRDAEQTRKTIRQLYNMYSIYTLFPLPLDMQGADFSSLEFKKNMKEHILEIVKEYKNTKGILLWLIGNEIDYSFTDDKSDWTTSKIKKTESPYKRSQLRARIVFEFVNEVANDIKKIDPNHPVGVSLGKTDYFSLLSENDKHLDYIGLNFYQGKNFSSIWSQFRKIDKPLLITEFGYDAFNTKKKKEDENTQSKFISSLWKDIEKNTFLRNVSAVSIGGCVFEWSDEWWKHPGGNVMTHDTNGSWVNPSWPDFVDGKPNVQEEWFGIVKLEKNPEKNQSDIRITRKAYNALKKLWNIIPKSSMAGGDAETSINPLSNSEPIANNQSNQSSSADTEITVGPSDDGPSSTSETVNP